jgi:hypothetical protein
VQHPGNRLQTVVSRFGQLQRLLVPFVKILDEDAE